MNTIDETPMLLTVPDAARLCSVSTKHMYRMLADGYIPSVKLGKRILVPRRALQVLAGEGFTGSNPTD